MNLESEMSPWEPDDLVKKQWLSEDYENITTVGHRQCWALGQWFHSYTSAANIKQGVNEVFWRSSSSERAKESGEDFIAGYNQHANVI